jgi:hypothetical protein
MLNRVPATLVFKRGFEFLLEPRSMLATGQKTMDTNMPMDESASAKRVKELASMLKSGSWTFFTTITCCDLYTPGNILLNSDAVVRPIGTKFAGVVGDA